MYRIRVHGTADVVVPGDDGIDRITVEDDAIYVEDWPTINVSDATNIEVEHNPHTHITEAPADD